MTWRRWQGPGSEVAQYISQSHTLDDAQARVALPLLAGQPAAALAGLLCYVTYCRETPAWVRDLSELWLPRVASEVGPILVQVRGEVYREQWSAENDDQRMAMMALQYAACLGMDAEINLRWGADCEDATWRLEIPYSLGGIQVGPVAEAALRWGRNRMRERRTSARGTVTMQSNRWGS